MKAVVQRAHGLTTLECCWKDIQGKEHRSQQTHEGPALVILLGWEQKDEKNFEKLLERENWIQSKILGLRIFPDQNQKTNLSLQQYTQNSRQRGALFWISQFTLAGELDSGFRPSFSQAMSPALARVRFEQFCESLKQKQDSSIQHYFGVFGADMDIQFTNWGPFTLIL